MKNAKHELSLAHHTGKVRALRSSFERVFDRLTAREPISQSVFTPVQYVYGQVGGERTMLGIAHNRGQLEDIVDFASTQGIVVEVVSGAVWKETFRDEEVARVANERIEEIRRQWDRGDPTPASVRKLIQAHFVLASLMIGIKTRPCIDKYARAGDDEILKMRGQVADQEGVGEKFVRDRLKDLCELFGSMASLDEYRKQLRIYHDKAKRGKYCDEAYTLRATTGRGGVRFMDEFSLLRLLDYSLRKKQKYVWFRRKVVVGHDEDGEDVVERSLQVTALRPYELAELIGLKLALRVRHEAVDVPEVRDMEWHMRRLAKWLQRRTDRPDRDGDLHETEVAKLPEDRETAKRHDDDDDPYYTALGIRVKSKVTGRINLVRTFGKLVIGNEWVVTRKTPNAWYIRRQYGYERTAIRQREITRKFLLSVRGKVVKTNKTTTVTTKRSLWHITARHEDRWDIQLVEKEETREVKLPDASHIVGDVETQLGNDTYFAKDVRYTERKEMQVVSNVAPLPVDEPIRKDWELFIGPKAPTVYKDRRLPMEDGEFQTRYVGPSFVKLTEIGGELVPTKAGRCGMHDPRYYAIHKSEGGDLKKCDACHVQKIQLRPESWRLKVCVKNTYEDPTGKGEPIVWEKWLPASLTDENGNPNVWIDRYVNSRGKTKERIGFAKIHADYEGEEPKFHLPMLTPVFRRFINECLWTKEMMIPPILTIVHKKGRLKGKSAERYDAQLEDIELMEMLGIEPTGLYDQFDGVERGVSKWDRVYATMDLFLPLTHPKVPQVFRLRTLPEGFKDLALQVQCSGLRAHLVHYTKECGGSIRHEYWREGPDEDSLWEPINRFRRVTPEGQVYHVNYVWE